MSKPNNPPAFPLEITKNGVGSAERGMTLRDYFAAKAMQAILSCQNADEDAKVVKAAWQIADMMLEERSK